jgi:ParB family chromosome partitioning protein
MKSRKKSQNATASQCRKFFLIHDYTKRLIRKEDPFLNVPIDNIIVAPDRNPIVEQTVLGLMDSIQKTTLINPITIGPDLKLIAGAHRLEACKRLGWTEIPAHQTTLDGLLAELAEIDENLIRNSDAHYLDADAKYLRRKEIYEALHPETKREATLKQYRTAETAKREAPSFNADVAQKVGTPERTLRKSIQRARDIVPEAQEEIRKVGLGKEKALEVARTPAEQQVEKVRELAFSKHPAKPTKTVLPSAIKEDFGFPDDVWEKMNAELVEEEKVIDEAFDLMRMFSQEMHKAEMAIAGLMVNIEPIKAAMDHSEYDWRGVADRFELLERNLTFVKNYILGKDEKNNG